MEIRRIGIIFNPIAGRGNGRDTAVQLGGLLEGEGIQVEIRESLAPPKTKEHFSFIDDSDALILAGGDGTLMGLLSELERSQTPIYMLPSGNESLFARQFGMTKNLTLALRAIKRGTVEHHFVPELDERPFFTMASIGLDSQVIEKIAQSRSGTIRHLSYMLPTIKAIIRHQAPIITLLVDGEEKLTKEKGFLILGNTSQYALGINFVPEANSRKAKLFGRFFPYQNILGYLNWCIQGLRTKSSTPTWEGVPFFEGTDFEISVANEGGYPIQADGEYVGSSSAKTAISDRTISILVP